MQPHRSAERRYLRDRGLSTETIERFQLGYSADAGGITIPYRALGGRVTMLKVRRLGHQKPKYLTIGHDFPLDQRQHIFNVADIVSSPLLICEGEFDTMLAVQYGYAAVGIAGVNNWMEHWGLLLPPQSVVVFDPDDAGVGGAHKLRAEAAKYGKSLRIATLDDGDITDTVIRTGSFDAVAEAVAASQ